MKKEELEYSLVAGLSLLIDTFDKRETANGRVAFYLNKEEAKILLENFKD